jgi:hypothetical protein
MTEDQIRGVIRDVLAARGLAVAPGPSAPRLTGGHPGHASHARLSMVVPTTPGSPCVIEPAVGCNQCGYCVSMGH